MIWKKIEDEVLSFPEKERRRLYTIHGFSEVYEEEAKWLSADWHKEMPGTNKYEFGGTLLPVVNNPVFLVYHDESRFKVNDDTRQFWQDSGTSSIKIREKDKELWFPIL